MSTAEYQAAAEHHLLRLPTREEIRAISATTWMLWGLIAAATIVRILTINNQSLWTDEALTAYESGLPFGSMVHVMLNIETTPPLYFLVAWGWGHIFGTSAIALRSISEIAGIGLVPIAYQCGRELVSKRVGLLAAAFVAVNPFLIWYSQEARAYMFMTALCGLSFLFFLRARRDPGRRNILLWGVWSGLAVMTHFFAGFLIAPEALWLLWLVRTRLMVGVSAGLLALQVAMVPFAAADRAHGTAWVGHIPMRNRIGNAIAEWAVSIMFRRTPVSTAFALGGLAVLLVAVLVLAGGDRRTRQAAAVTGVMVAFVWLVPIGLKFFHQDFFLSRNVMPSVVPMVVLLAAACLAPRTRWFGGALAVVFLGLFSWSAIRVQTHPYLERPNWRSVARAIGPAPVPRMILAADGTTADPLKIYLPHASWTEPLFRKMWVYQVYVVGATKRLPLAPVSKTDVLRRRHHIRVGMAAPTPAYDAPPGTFEDLRFGLHNWILARFVFERPVQLSYVQASAMAHLFFHRTPRDLLVIFQHPGR